MQWGLKFDPKKPGLHWSHFVAAALVLVVAVWVLAWAEALLGR
jgi:hypothetical protein